MATIIFDFDDTLFSTHKLKDSIFGKMESLGIPSEVIRQTYEKSVQQFKNYTPNNHIAVINETEEFNIPDHKAKEINTIDFSFHKIDETYNILNQLSKEHTLILLTVGDKDFQELKIRNSGFSSCFHQIHIISDKKEKFLADKKFEGDIYFINDKKSENDIIKKIFSNFKVIDFDIKNQGSLSRLPFIS